MTAAPQVRRFQGDHSQRNSRAMIAKIHVAKRELGMNEDDYRQLLMDTVGCASLTQCKSRELERIIARMQALGFKPISKSGGRPAAQHPMAKKARALWLSLYNLNVVRNASESALEAFAKRQLGCEKLVWARQSDANRLIEALKDMAKRAGWMQHDPNTGKPLPPILLHSNLCHVILRKLKEGDAVPECWSLDDAAWRLCGIETARETGFTAEDYIQLARALGDKLRTLVPAENA